MSSENRQVSIPEIITVKDFAERADLPVVAVISELMKNGILANINETIDFDTASIIGEYLGITLSKSEDVKSPKSDTKSEVSQVQKLEERPPVVTIMGHVDHGKTSLLDKIRSSKVASGESGGITQHISAYQVQLDETKNKNIRNKTITFIDTPGHAAFSAMREHGTVITDIVVLIVAANDGVKPQTIEVIEQARENNVPVIVAINKVDLPDADTMKTKQQLSEHGLVAEEWGGKTIMVEVSAKTGQGVDELLEIILLQAEIMELRGCFDCSAVGVVIESRMEKGSGPVAIVLIENGKLKQGDPISIGSSSGKIRSMKNYLGESIEAATPSMPVLISGLKSVPDFGEKLVVFGSEKMARENASQFERSSSSIRVATAKKMKSDSNENETAEIKQYNLIVKADVKGSLEAIRKSLGEIIHPEIKVNLVSDGIGQISESDATLAKATGADIYGFRVQISGAAKKIVELETIKYKLFKVIYELIDTVKAEMSSILPPEVIEEEIGHGQVLAIFRDDKKGFVAGGRVDKGSIKVGDEIKILQNNNEKYRAKVVTLRREKSEVKECESGSECGFGLPVGAKVAVGDTFIVYKTIYKKKIVE